MKKILIVDDIKGWRDFNSNVAADILGEDIEILTADCAAKAYDLVLGHNATPFDIIFTDLQMEDDYTPKYAGEWLVEQIKMLKSYSKTKIIMISASYNIRHIAETLGVECIPKSTAMKCLSVYEEVLKS